MGHGRMLLIRTMSQWVGIPQGRPPSGRGRVRATGASGIGDTKSRRTRSRGWVFVSPERDRWRIWCEHKQGSVLDRTVTASTLERLYGTALAAGAREVVLP